MDTIRVARWMVTNASTAYRQAYPIAKGSAAGWNFDTPGNENRAGSNVLAIRRTRTLYLFRRSEVKNLWQNVRYTKITLQNASFCNAFD